jgi:tetratricopeptide (TPR) repeat protein
MVTTSVLGVLAGALWFAANDVRLGKLEYAIRSRDIEAAKRLSDTEIASASGDHRGWMSAATVAAGTGKPLEAQERLLRRSIAAGPTLAAYRALARVQEAQEKTLEATASLQAALEWDPNNLLALNALLRLEQTREGGKPMEVARRIVDVESTPYYQVRAIPELVITDTLPAHLVLASGASDAEKLTLLRSAVEVYLKYCDVTVPKILEFAKLGMDGGYGGESVAGAQAKVEQAKEALEFYSRTPGFDSELSRSVSVRFEEVAAALSESK